MNVKIVGNLRKYKSVVSPDDCSNDSQGKDSCVLLGKRENGKVNVFERRTRRKDGKEERKVIIRSSAVTIVFLFDELFRK